jgi:hypothetical protein
MHSAPPGGQGRIILVKSIGVNRRRRQVVVAWGTDSVTAVWLIIDRGTRMKILSYIYRFISNFIFLAFVYYTLNYLGTYQQRAIVSILVLLYSAMRAASAVRSFYFFQKIERLEVEARRLSTAAGDGNAPLARKQIISEVGNLRRYGEMKSYIDLLFLALVVVLCVSKIVTE